MHRRGTGFTIVHLLVVIFLSSTQLSTTGDSATGTDPTRLSDSVLLIHDN